MKRSLLPSAGIFALFFFLSLRISAQDTWTPSETDGFGDFSNHSVLTMQSFKGKLYAGGGDYTGNVFVSPTGNMGSWVNVFNAPYVVSIDDLASATDGGGYLYVSAYAYGGDYPKVYRTADGTVWDLYYSGTDRIKFMEPFKGTGTVDSMYVFQNGTYGTLIKRAAYDALDPLDTLGTWDTVLDFAAVSIYTSVTSTVVHNGKLYAGTNNGCTLWSTADGVNWSQNTFVGNGFGDPNNYEISALESFGGFLYAATFNYMTGTQIWRADTDSTWAMVSQYSGYERVTDFGQSGTTLWASLYQSYGVPHIIKSTDGLTFFQSDNDGFGDINNNGHNGNFCTFGNNIYYACENFGFSPAAIHPGGTTIRGGGFSNGGEIWRSCLLTPPSVNVGADQTICVGTPAVFTATPGFSAYIWEDGSPLQSLSTFLSGSHYVIATDANGCDATDTAAVAVLQKPDATLTNPASFSTVCYGSSANVTGTATSNLRLPLPPYNKVTNTFISNSLPDSYDTIAVSGITECSCTALYSVTIDSLYHQYDGDVSIGLYSPSGSFINLLGSAYGTNFIGTELIMNAAGYAGNMGTAPFTGQFLPLDPFSNLSGSATGNWILQMNDNYVTDDGVLKGWTLKFTYADSMLTYSWNPTTGVSLSTSLNTTITPPTTGTYVLTTTNTVGCTDLDTLTFFVPEIIAATTNDSICFGMSTTLACDGASTSAWSPSGTLSSSTGTTVTATPSVSTMYYVSDLIAGCAAVDSVMITVNAPLVPDAGNGKGICYGDSTSIYGTTTGGVPPYTEMWSDGVTSYFNNYAAIGPLTTTTYNFFTTDAFGCSMSDSLTISVAPSTDIYGHVGYSGGSVASSNVVLYKYYPYLTHFDTVQTTTTDAAGNYHFGVVNHKDYLIEVFPAATYTTLVPTYYGDRFLWDSASVVYHYCAANDTLNIAMVEEILSPTGPGYLHGTIVEDTGYVRAPGDPIPGVDVKLGRNPGGQLVTSTQTNSSGQYSFSNVAYGDYVVYADIPGLGRDSSYTFTVDSINTIYNYLDYEVDDTTIHIIPNAGVGLHPVAGAEPTFRVYPNPSKGNATIEYSLGTNAEVSLGIYNMLGVKISEIVNAQQPAGNYKYTIADKGLSSGVYFVTLINNGKTSIHKIIITE